MQRSIAFFVCAALVLTGCGTSITTPPAANILPAAPYLITAPTTIDSFTSTTALAVSSVGPVLPLFAIPGIQTNDGNASLVMWGSKDASGNITDITQAGITISGNPSGSVSVFFDASQHPVLFRDDSSGYSLKFSYDSATQLTVTLCDPQGNAQGYSTVNTTSQTVADGGSCVLSNLLAHARLGRVRLPSDSGRDGTCSKAPQTNVCNLSGLAQLITAGSYVAGMGFAIGAIAKFKAHKDNPTQIPIGTPIALIFIAAALLFIPGIFNLSPPGSLLLGDANSAGSTLLNVDTTPPASDLGTPYAGYSDLDASGGFQ